MSLIAQRESPRAADLPGPGESDSYAVRLRDSGATRFYGTGAPRFTLVVNSFVQGHHILYGDLYAAARAFVCGEFDVNGDLFAAIRFARTTRRRGLSQRLHSALARLTPVEVKSWFQTRWQAAQDVRFHYDLPLDFYRQFLDSHLNYSCAYFTSANCSLEQAQLAKLDHICRKLDLRPGDRFLDVGCGWGGLVAHAASRYACRRPVAP